MPDVEVWTFQGYDQLAGRVKRVGINFGAPGDWRGPNGTLWLDSPEVVGRGPRLAVEVAGAARYFRHNAMEMQGPAPQVTASGVEGASSIRIPMHGTDDKPYTVRLYFAEPEAATAIGARVFNVSLQGKSVLKDLDIVREAGGSRRALIKEFRNITVREALMLELKSAKGSRLPALICGVEAVMEP